MSFTPEIENKLNRELIETLSDIIRARNERIRELKKEKGVLHRRLNKEEEG